MQKHFNCLVLGIVLGAGLMLFSPAQIAAQSANLQNNNAGNLQPQAGGTQNPTNTQRQSSDPLQQGQGQSLLNQSSPRALGVVSDPSQSQPEAVVEPDPDLRAGVSQLPATSGTPAAWIGGAIALFALIVAYLIWRSLKQEESGHIQEVVIEPQPEAEYQQVAKPKKTKKKKAKRKKPHQR